MGKFVILISLLTISITASAYDGVYNYDVRYYIDRTDRMTPADVLQLFQEQGGTLAHHTNLNFGFNPHTLWIYMETPPSGNGRYLTIENAHIDTLDIYEWNKDGKIRATLMGDQREFAARDVNIHYFNQSLRSNTREILIRAKTEGSLMIPITLLPLDGFVNRYRNQELFHFMYFGIMALAFLINLFLFFRFRDWNYFFYIVGILSLVVITAVDFGYLFQFVYPNYPGINVYNSAYYATSIALVIFTGKFLRIRSRSFLFYILYWIIIGLGVGIIAISFLGHYNLAIKLVSVLILIAPIFIVAGAAYCYYRLKLEEARFILFGWLANLVAIVIYMLTILEVLPFNFFTGNIVQIGSSLEVTFFFIALIDQVVILRKEKEILLEHQKLILEEQLKERTREIYEINEELIVQNEELLARRDLVEQQKATIQNQNEQLKNNQALLENIVAERTGELSDANKSLADKNKRLEQFAFVAAHNLRGPVATLKGLVLIFNKVDYADLLNKEIMSEIEVTLEKLDLVIRDMAMLLSQHDDLGAMRRPVDLSEILKKTKLSLLREISECNAEITDNFPSESKYQLIPSYISNILYNLLSNALVHRSKSNSPVIRLELEDLHGKIIIKVTDNGDGIDMKKYEGKLFRPYQKLQKDKPGKGIGLFITKSQVDAMNGEITIYSALGQGTRVDIILPAM